MAGTALAPAKVPVRKTSAKRGHRSRLALVNAVPVTVFLLVLFVYPIIGVLSLSLKGDSGAFTLHWYTDALSGANLSVLLSTLRIS
ncbi:ABC transporter permease, partial [Streptomyces chartreusis]